MSTIKKLEQLKGISGSNSKKTFIQRNLDDEVFAQALFFLLNPYITVGISTKKIKKKLHHEDISNPIDSLYSAMSYLQNHSTGRDIDVIRIQNFLETLPEDEQGTATDLLTKKLTLGVQGKTVNSIREGFIPEFNPMLAKEFYENSKKIKGKDMSLSVKLDGVRCIALRDSNSVDLFSRNGKPFIGLTEVEESFLQLPIGVYDGELLADREEGESTPDLYRRTVGMVNSNENVTGVKHIAFDCIPLEEWKNQKSTTKHRDRFELLQQILREHKVDNVELVEHLGFTDDIEDVTKQLKRMTELGYEGVMVNDRDAVYEFKRGNALFKAKEFDSGDLRVLAVVEGQGKYEGMMGKIIVEYKGNEVGVGTGFSDAERVRFFQDPSSIVGKIVRIDYQTESQDKDGVVSLRFPSFEGILHDKTEPRYSDKGE